jgi:hypothetical protein
MSPRRKAVGFLPDLGRIKLPYVSTRVVLACDILALHSVFGRTAFMKLHQDVCHYCLVEVAWFTINKASKFPLVLFTVFIFPLPRVSLVTLDG